MKTLYHFGLKKDEKRNAWPIQAYMIAGITFHVRTAQYDRAEGDYRHKAGQVLALDEEQVKKIKDALRIDRAPKDLDRTVIDGKFVDSRAEKYRAIARGEGVGSGFKATELRDVDGFGKVVQWSPVMDDEGKKVVGWLSRVLDISDRDYQPLENPENEVPLHNYVFLEVKKEQDFNPPAIDMGGEEAAAAAIENQEQARDPVGFEKTKEQNRRAKAAGRALEVHTPGA